jgi:DNA-binding transcriptional LysR family regulator
VSLASLDLNLLLVLNSVLSERSVARAAQRLHVTPSAISNSLARLRAALGDPLFTRKGRGIVPTPRAVELGPALAHALSELERVITRAPFDAASCTRIFTLAMADAGQVAWLPLIAGRLRQCMPSARLRIVGIDSLLALGDLASSEVDLHVGVRATGAGIHAEPLLDERTLLIARKNHPARARRLTRRTLGLLQHVGVEMAPGRGFRDPVAAAYARARISRSVVLSVPTFAAAAAVVAKSDLVATLPASVFDTYVTRLGLGRLQGPVPHHSVAMALCWHDRTHQDPAMAAFRALVRTAIVSPDGQTQVPAERKREPLLLRQGDSMSASTQKRE